MCGALVGWQVSQRVCAWLGGGAPWHRSHAPGGVASSQRGSVAAPPAPCSASPWQYTLRQIAPSHAGGPLRSAGSRVIDARAPNVTLAAEVIATPLRRMWPSSSQRAGTAWHSLHATPATWRWTGWALLVGPAPWHVVHAVGPSA